MKFSIRNWSTNMLIVSAFLLSATTLASDTAVPDAMHCIQGKQETLRNNCNGKVRIAYCWVDDVVSQYGRTFRRTCGKGGKFYSHAFVLNSGQSHTIPIRGIGTQSVFSWAACPYRSRVVAYPERSTFQCISW